MNRNERGAITVDDVSKRYRIYHDRNQSLKSWVVRGFRNRYEEFWALKDVTIDVVPGETFGLIGENGCGKSTLLKCIAGILRPDEGSIAANGKIAALIELGAGFHPELSGRDNVFLNGSLLGLSTKEVERRFDGIVGFAGLEQFIDTPVKNYSSGMYMRLGFSIAISIDPEIMLIDEILAVGDEQFQRRCLAKLAELKAGGCTIILVSHDLRSVRMLCDRAALIEHGHLRDVGSAGAVIDGYLGIDAIGIARPHTAEARWGSGEALITAVDFLGAGSDAEPLHSVRSGETLRLRLHFGVHQPIDDPIVGVTIHTPEGLAVMVPTTAMTGCTLPRLAGDGHVDAVIDDLPLGPGVYRLTAFLQDRAGTHAYDVRHHFVEFTVDPGGEVSHNGVIAIAARWESPTVS